MSTNHSSRVGPFICNLKLARSCVFAPNRTKFVRVATTTLQVRYTQHTDNQKASQVRPARLTTLVRCALLSFVGGKPLDRPREDTVQIILTPHRNPRFYFFSRNDLYASLSLQTWRVIEMNDLVRTSLGPLALLYEYYFQHRCLLATCSWTQKLASGGISLPI